MEHGPLRRGKYKKYLRDLNAPIPRTTKWRMMRRNADATLVRGSSLAAPLIAGTCSEDCSESTSTASTPGPPALMSLSESTHDSEHHYHCDESPLMSESDSGDTDHPLFTPESETEHHDESPLMSESDTGDTDHPLFTPESATEHMDLQCDDESCHLITNDHMQPEYLTKIYSGSDISLCAANCAIMKFATSHNLTYSAIDDLLHLLKFFCPKPNAIPSTIYKLKKFFKDHEIQHVNQRFCTKCKNIQEECECEQVQSTNIGNLVSIAIEKPLQAVLSDNWNSLLSSKDPSSVITDVWDAEKLTSDDFFSSSSNLALSLFTDGVPVFKSSKVSIWPVYYIVLNLPPSVRTKASNIILSGIWVGPTKPPMQHLLHPLTQKIQDLSTVGIRMNSPNGIITVRAKLVLGIFDLPAKAIVINCKQYNGKYGCSICLHPGKRLSGRMVYPPHKCNLRTHDSIVSLAHRATTCGKAIKGIKGISPLTQCLDLVDSIPVDYMHAVLEGVLGRLMRLWFDSKNHSKPYYQGRHLNEIDSILLLQTPPNEFSRAPRPIKSHLKYWKATELRQWLLFYSLPILLGKLPAMYWQHYALLVTAMHILLKNKISINEINAAELMITDFCELYCELYDEVNFTHNVHLLTHLIKYVKLWGPLWTHSSFAYENKNGILKSDFHGTNCIFQQLLFNVNAKLTIHSLLHQIKSSDGERVAEYLGDDNNLTNNMTSLGQHVYAVGQIEAIALTEEQQDLLQYYDNNQAFSRLFKEGTTYHSTRYNKCDSGKRNNTFCMFTKQDSNKFHYGQIHMFVLKPMPCALLYEVTIQGSSLMQQARHVSHSKLVVHERIDILNNILSRAAISDELVAININNIIKKAVFISVPPSNYIASLPNPYEYH